MKEERKLAAILFTDIQSFSSFLHQQEELVLKFLQQTYYPLADQFLKEFQGELIRREGDAIVAEFSSPQNAVFYAEKFQQALNQYHQKNPEPSLKIRIGIHVGEVLHQNGEVLGHTLSVAKRLESFCHVGGVCISQEVMQHLKTEKLPLYFQDQGMCALKGVGRVHIYQGHLAPPTDGFTQTIIPFFTHQIQNQDLLFICGPYLNNFSFEKNLIKHLAPEAQDLNEAAQLYEEEHSREELHKTLTFYFAQQKLQPAEELLLTLPLDLILTTTIGGPFHQALEARQEKNLASENGALNYFSFFGSVKQNNFWITEDDVDLALAHLESLPIELSGALATKTLVFIGCSPNSRLLKNFYRRLSDLVMLEESKRRFILWKEPTNSERWWKNKGVEVLETTTNTFLERLSQSLLKSTEDSFESFTPPLLSKRPYKFLDYYNVEDQAIFFGREEDVPKIMAKIYSQNLVLLYAKSGSGKTSLINAALHPTLEKEGYLTCYIRLFEDPIYAIKRAINLQLDSPIEEAEDLMLWAFLRNASKKARRPIILFLDQFEEFFIRLGIATQNNFVHELERCLKKGESQTRFIFSMREDFLAELESFKEQIPEVFYHGYRLKGLTQEQAERAIIEPAKLLGIEWETPLLKLLLQDLSEGTVEPPHLQIVCDQLYDKREKQKILLAHYENSGGATKLLAEYMTSVLEGMEENERGVAEKILKGMVTSLETKSLLAVEELLAQIDENEIKETQKILEYLINQRLLRSFEHDGKPYCELAHDFLAIQIRSWLDEEEFKAKEVRDILRQELNNWKNFQWVPDLPKLEVFTAQKENPHLRFFASEIELILRSCLKHQQFFDYWWERALNHENFQWKTLPSLYHSENPVECAYALEVAKELNTLESVLFIKSQIHNEAVSLREKTVELLTALKETESLEQILPLLNDPYPSVRWRVIRYLQALKNQKAKEVLLSYQPEDMILIEAGPFIMGSDVNPEEGPVQTVELPSYYIDKYPVRNKDYALFVKATKRATPKHWEKGTFATGEEEHPVVHVSGHDAKAYAKWAGKRLPSEAEWEKAARGTEERKYPWGDDIDPTRCNCLETGIGTTVPVGQYSPQGDSPYGVVDIAGQVWEWTSCWFNAYEGSNYESQYYGKQVIAIRGGSWSSQISLCRTTYRGMGHPDYPFAHGGFRCVMEIPAKESH